jgi:hypothetical protein
MAGELLEPRAEYRLHAGQSPARWCSAGCLVVALLDGGHPGVPGQQTASGVRIWSNQGKTSSDQVRTASTLARQGIDRTFRGRNRALDIPVLSVIVEGASQVGDHLRGALKLQRGRLGLAQAEE